MISNIQSLAFINYKATMNKREFENHYQYEEYDDSFKIYDFESNQLNGEIKDSFKEKIGSLLENFENSLATDLHLTPSFDNYVYHGKAGIALFYMHLMDSELQVAEKDYIKCALSYVEPYLSQLAKQKFSFLGGYSGPLAIMAVIFHHKGMDKESQEFCQRVESLAQFMYGHEDKNDEFLYGRAGYIYSLLYLNKHLGRAESRDETIRRVICAIVKSGLLQATAFAQGHKRKKRITNTYVKSGIIQECDSMKKINTSLYFEWHEKAYIGAAHGLSGILYILLQAKDYIAQETLEGLKFSVDFVLNLQFPSGNFPSSLGNETDRLVQWCHGAPGMAYLLLLAYEIYRDDKYLDAARICSDVIWKRGLLKKGYGLCHGVAGNGYAHLKLFQVTKEVQYLQRAIKFAEWCFDYEKRTCPTPDRPLSLFEGMAGTLYYLIDILDPMKAAFPAFQLS